MPTNFISLITFRYNVHITDCFIRMLNKAIVLLGKLVFFYELTGKDLQPYCNSLPIMLGLCQMLKIIGLGLRILFYHM